MSAASAPLLSMRGIDKSFGNVPALTGAALEVREGEVMALIGQNGAGKSTMIKVLNGYCAKDGGTIEFAGRPWSSASPQAAQRQGVSTIFQEINLIPFRSVTENIFLGRELRRFGLLDWKRMNEAARALLAEFDIDVDARKPLERFSTAVQQMVAIARAVSFDARLVIMDEPTSSLDEHEVAVLFGTIRRLKAKGVAVIFVSHKLDELYEVCDRVTVMRDGRTVAVAPLAEMTKLQLVATMLGRDLAEVSRRGATAFDESAKHAAGEELLGVSGLAVGKRVRDARLSVRRGEIVGLAGLLGAGRTETARAVFAASRHEKGEIRVAGATAAFREPADAIAAGIGFCSEDRKHEGIIPSMSVRENMTLALLPALSRSGIVDETRQRAVVERFIRDIGIKCAGPEQKIRELSGGNQQKVLLARWLCMDPRLLILDEPTRGIDVGAKAEIQRLIGRLADDGLGVLMISSEIEEIVEGSDRVFVLREGVTAAELAGDEISEPRVLEAMAHGHREPAPEGEEAAA
jgi:galactofuranose transport system ATP-binding protein